MNQAVAEIRSRWKQLMRSFEERVERITESGCWFWMGQIKRRGYPYGRWYIGLRERYAHRLAWMLFRGPIPAGMRVLHRCDVPFCVNPAHLFVGTAADNTHDMVRKGRARWNPDSRGERNGNAKLTADQVAEIRASSLPGTVLAAKYGVSSTLIYFIRKNKNWRSGVA